MAAPSSEPLAPNVATSPSHNETPSGDSVGYLGRQLELAWALTQYHLNGLTTEECLWRPAKVGLHVHRAGDGVWRADWPDRETYDLGPPSIGWLTWHIGFWWSMAYDHSFGSASLTRDDVAWPGDADGVREWLDRLHRNWVSRLNQLTDADLQSAEQTRWPFRDRPFGEVVGWANVELMKNAAEIGYARFLFAVRER